jgi:His/Glu/Gln/Arg/opine family amino acid ABC transporter permease subunit
VGVIEFFRVFIQRLPEWWPEMQVAAVNTLLLTASAFGIAIGLGLCLALCRLGRTPILDKVAVVYIEFMRGVPALVVLFIVYFGVVPLGITLNAFVAGAVGLGIHAAAYVAEIFRSGIEAIHRGQREAAMAVGMTPRQMLRYIVLPQATTIMLPPLINMLVIVLKDTSICSLISTPEIMLRAKDLASTYFRPMHLYVLAGALYFAMAWPLSLLARRWARHLARGRRS